MTTLPSDPTYLAFAVEEQSAHMASVMKHRSCRRCAWLCFAVAFACLIGLAVIGCNIKTDPAPVNPIFPAPIEAPSNGPQIEAATTQATEAEQAAVAAADAARQLDRENFDASKSFVVKKTDATVKETRDIFPWLYQALAIDQEAVKRNAELTAQLLSEREERINERTAATTQIAAMKSTIEIQAKEITEYQDGEGKSYSRWMQRIGGLLAIAGLIVTLASSQKKFGACLLAGGLITTGLGFLTAFYAREYAIATGIVAVLTVVLAIVLLWRQSRKNKDEAQLNETAATEIIQAIQQAKRYQKIPWTDEVKKAFEDILGDRAVELVKKETK